VAQPKELPEVAISKLPLDLIKGANAVVRFHEEKLEIIDASKAIRSVRLAITILNEKGAEQDGNIVVFYDGEFYKLKEVVGAVYDKRGNREEKIKEKDLMDRSPGTFEVDDTRYKFIDLGPRSMPYTLYYEYEEKVSGTMYIQPWAPLDRTKKSIQRASFEVRVPKDLDIRHKELGPVEEPDKREDSETGEWVYTWKMENVKPYVYEPYTPRSPLPTVLLAPNKFEIAGYEGRADNWKDFGKFHYHLNEGRQKISPAMAEKVKEMTASAPSTQEKVDILYDFLQENTRYMSIQLGIGGFQTIPAQKVEQTGYGDCKALTYYMKGMLEAIDIPSYACLIRAGSNASPMVTDFSSTQFNHVMLAVPQEEDTIWVECTADDIPAGYLTDFGNDRHVLMLTKEGGLIRKTPTPDPEDNLQLRKATVFLSDNGDAKAEVKTILTGFQQDNIRAMATYADPRQKERWLHNRLGVSSAEITNFQIEKEKNRPICSLDYQLSCRNWAKKSGSRLFLKLHQLEAPISIPHKDEDRKLPVVWKVAFQDQDSIFIDIPEGYVVESMNQEEIIVDRPYGHYKASVQLTDQGDILYKREWELDKCFLDPEEYEAFREFFMEVRKADQQQVVLNKRS